MQFYEKPVDFGWFILETNLKFLEKKNYFIVFFLTYHNCVLE